MADARGMHTYETTQPWVLYHYGLTHDLWWPFWNSTRILGRARMVLECMVCGERKRVSIRIPRVGKVPDRGHHPVRNAFLAEHAHPDRGAPMSWAKPLANLAAHPGGMSLDGLAMRLEADLNDGSTLGVGQPMNDDQCPTCGCPTECAEGAYGRLHEALEFYADNANWQSRVIRTVFDAEGNVTGQEYESGPAWGDSGKRARQALGLPIDDGGGGEL